MLTEVGFLAAARADVVHAESIFGALERLRPERSFPYIGMAMCYLNAGRHDDAARVLERAAKAVVTEDVDEVQAVRALALQMAGRASECDRALKAAGNHPVALALQGLGQGTITP